MYDAHAQFVLAEHLNSLHRCAQYVPCNVVLMDIFIKPSWFSVTQNYIIPTFASINRAYAQIYKLIILRPNVSRSFSALRVRLHDA
jgi:hypothetical protein